MAIEKVALSSLIAQAWDQLRGMVLEEVKKRIEELARAEQTSRLGRAPHRRGGNSLLCWFSLKWKVAVLDKLLNSAAARREFSRHGGLSFDEVFT